ncbi:orotidine 5'-phosphate decarboxylase [Anoxybacter fermentans]|uniref:Orotidine 5'-phosphate decarboxylase n=1 Tax=Anoxybacter fermentans TaxID=1323375 RepID=A0A3Q9HQ86_9FIRM|nr:orotidine-5'-phosphate decarboxylase [Anoxybacter fermentans]AZR73009.1 orotidine 5'-phosphate decarboxylase [Anoxybacter fermentans]
MQAIDRLIAKIEEKNSCVCVGLDPRFERIPEEVKKPIKEKMGETLEGLAQVLINFNYGILEAVEPYAPVVKFQISFYEQYGPAGLKALIESCKISREMGFEIILDAKRNDISSTAKAYADGYLGKVNLWGREEFIYDLDSMTVNPYLGKDGLEPFIEVAQKYDKGVWVLLKTSNPSSGDLQDLTLASGEKVYERLALQLQELGTNWCGESGYSNLGMVVGATYPEAAARLRKMLPRTFFLIPGYGAQGAVAAELEHFFNPDGLGGIVNSSRGIIFARKKDGEDYKSAARRAVLKMKQKINTIRGGRT